MNSTLNKVLIFCCGAAVGSAVTWKLLKTKYEQIANEEIESVKEVFSRPQQATPSEGDTERYDEATIDSGTVEKYKDMVNNLYHVPAAEEEVDVDRPYVISPEEFGDLDNYNVVSLTYYSDGVLIDEEGNIVDDVDDLVGEDFASHYGEYEEDSVFVRNDARMTDYEILRDYEPYHSRPTEE